jgi:hypothetical protein
MQKIIMYDIYIHEETKLYFKCKNRVIRIKIINFLPPYFWLFYI